MTGSEQAGILALASGAYLCRHDKGRSLLMDGLAEEHYWHWPCIVIIEMDNRAAAASTNATPEIIQITKTFAYTFVHVTGKRKKNLQNSIEIEYIGDIARR